MSEAVSGDLQTVTRELSAIDADDHAGEVVWYSAERGYGFIAPDSGGPEVFVRHSGIQCSGFRSLDAGQRVTFKQVDDARGPRAIDVHPSAG